MSASRAPRQDPHRKRPGSAHQLRCRLARDRSRHRPAGRQLHGRASRRSNVGEPDVLDVSRAAADCRLDGGGAASCKVGCTANHASKYVVASPAVSSRRHSRGDRSSRGSGRSVFIVVLVMDGARTSASGCEPRVRGSRWPETSRCGRCRLDRHQDHRRHLVRWTGVRYRRVRRTRLEGLELPRRVNVAKQRAQRDADGEGDGCRGDGDRQPKAPLVWQFPTTPAPRSAHTGSRQHFVCPTRRLLLPALASAARQVLDHAVAFWAPRTSRKPR